MEKIYILGNGEMALCLAYGLKSKFEVILVSRKPFNSDFKNEIYGERYDINNKNIILAFKPYALKGVSDLLNGEAKTCISVLARTSLDNIKIIKSQNYAICLPNLAAKFKASITPFMRIGNDKIVEILQTFGKAIEFNDKMSFDAASIVSGCAPAYLALIAESIVSGAVLNGVNAKLANELTIGLFDSFTKILEQTKPAQIKEQICSPAGTTIAGIYELEKCGVRGSVMKALESSFKKQQGKAD